MMYNTFFLIYTPSIAFTVLIIIFITIKHIYDTTNVNYIDYFAWFGMWEDDAVRGGFRDLMGNLTLDA